MKTATTTAKAETMKTPAKVSHAKTKAHAPELPNISSVKLVPLALIDVQPQVRTIFDEDSIADLAADIQARGLLQPVLLNPHGDRFTLIAGERRVRACRLAELSDIPALITKASTADALLMQLAENIQREDLDLEDEVKAIRQLHDSLGTVAAVADTIKKSAAWVSKRLALSHPDLAWQARQLMQDGITEDVEILNCLSAIGERSYSQANTLAQQIREGTATRDTARQMLKDLKAEAKATPTATDEERAEQRKEEERRRKAWENEQEAAKIEEKEGCGERFIANALRQLQNECAEPGEQGNDGTTYLNTLREDQRAAILAHLQALQTTASTWNFTELGFAFTPYDSDYSYLEQFAIILAMKKQPVDLYAMVAILEAANLFKDNDA